MPEYLRDHLPEFIITLGVLVIFLRQIRQKSLIYTILTNSSVIADRDKDRVQVVYDGRSVPEVRLLEVRIRNTGSLPIEPRDYLEPLSLYLHTARILSSELQDPHASGARIETDGSNQSRIVLSKTLLNPRQSFDVKMLLTGGDADLLVDGQIAGIKGIRSRSDRDSSYDILLSLVIVNLLALTARYFALLDRSFVITLQIFTVLVGLWMRSNLWTESQYSQE